MKHLRCNVLHSFAVGEAAGNVSVDAFEIALIEFGETRRVALGRFHEKPLIGLVFQSRQRDLRAPGLNTINQRDEKRLRPLFGGTAELCETVLFVTAS